LDVIATFRQWSLIEGFFWESKLEISSIDRCISIIKYQACVYTIGYHRFRPIQLKKDFTLENHKQLTKVFMSCRSGNDILFKVFEVLHISVHNIQPML
jgi:hypothetical protein